MHGGMNDKERRKPEPQQRWKDKRPWFQFSSDGTTICSFYVEANQIIKVTKKIKMDVCCVVYLNG